MSNYNLKTSKAFLWPQLFRQLFRHKLISFYTADFLSNFSTETVLAGVINKKKKEKINLTTSDVIAKAKKQRNDVKRWCHLVFCSSRRLKVFQKRFNVVSFRNSDSHRLIPTSVYHYRCVGNKYKLPTSNRSKQQLHQWNIR